MEAHVADYSKLEKQQLVKVKKLQASLALEEAKLLDLRILARQASAKERLIEQGIIPADS
jgi:hypothetical protein